MSSSNSDQKYTETEKLFSSTTNAEESKEGTSQVELPLGVKKNKKKKKSRSLGQPPVKSENSPDILKEETSELTKPEGSKTDFKTTKKSLSSEGQPFTCQVPTCKNRLTITSITCQFCNMTYCMTHRYPESHSSKCAEKTRNLAHAEFQQESMRFIAEERRNPGMTNKKSFNLEKSKEDIKKRYKEKLETAKRKERGGGSKG
ncbi:hypothetical protein G9A89_011007 [Geosiphon pyriformis]|nr:hypothetical protein G9A89_011007 [Geosiphon pyriformis]